jgi:hypothetical protein
MEMEMILSELIERTLQEMERMQYAPLSIKEHKRMCNHLVHYAEEHGIGAFTEQMGAAFLKEKYGYPPFGMGRASFKQRGGGSALYSPFR